MPRYRSGTGNAHHFVNETSDDAVYLEIGDRTTGGGVIYPDDDVQLTIVDGKSKFTHKDGTPC